MTGLTIGNNTLDLSSSSSLSSVWVAVNVAYGGLFLFMFYIVAFLIISLRPGSDKIKNFAATSYSLGLVSLFMFIAGIGNIDFMVVFSTITVIIAVVVMF